MAWLPAIKVPCLGKGDTTKLFALPNLGNACRQPRYVYHPAGAPCSRLSLTHLSLDTDQAPSALEYLPRRCPGGHHRLRLISRSSHGITATAVLPDHQLCASSTQLLYNLDINILCREYRLRHVGKRQREWNPVRPTRPGPGWAGHRHLVGIIQHKCRQASPRAQW